MVRVAVIQLGLPLREDDAAVPDTSIVAESIEQATQAGAEVVVLPELWRTGPFELESTLDLARDLDADEITILGRIAATLGIWLCAGSVLEKPQGDAAVYNTTVLFDSAGNLAATYRKRHLFGFDSGEAALLTSGDDVVVVDTPLGPTGLATCYDLRFPEHFRALLDAGAHCVLLPSGWPLARVSHWRLLSYARAIENQMWVIGANSVGTSGKVTLAGNSLVVDPWGHGTEAGSEPTTLLVDIDPALPGVTRREFPVLRDRRPTRHDT
jgi:predicted amidohydrolase